jgi:hypothetical protein
MSVKEQIAADANIFINENDFAEQATYEGVQIIGILDYDNGQLSGNPYNNEGQSTKGLYYLTAANVIKIGTELNRSSGYEIQGVDQIIHAGRTWYVIRLKAVEIGIYTLEISSNESAWG